MSSKIDKPTLKQRFKNCLGMLKDDGWDTGDVDYLSPCRISAEDIPEMIQLVLERCNDDRLVNDYDPDFDYHSELAWRVLGQLRAQQGVGPLVSILLRSDDVIDDRFLEEVPAVFGMIGEPALQPLMEVLTNEANQNSARLCAADSIQQIGRRHPELRRDAIEVLETELSRCHTGDEKIASILVAGLLDLDATEAAETIESAYSANLVDTSEFSDWSDVKQKLGVQGIGLPMPESSTGSGRLEFTPEKARKAAARLVNESDAAFDEALCEQNQTLGYLFEHSPEFEPLAQVYFAWPELFLSLLANFCGESFTSVSPAVFEEALFEIFPKNVTTKAEFGPRVVKELQQFFKFIDREFKTEHARSIVNGLSDEAGARLKSLLADQSDFGFAQSFLPSDKAAGVDMTSESMDFPEELFAPTSASSRMTADEKRAWNKKRKKKLAKKLEKKKRR